MESEEELEEEESVVTFMVAWSKTTPSYWARPMTACPTVASLVQRPLGAPSEALQPISAKSSAVRSRSDTMEVKSASANAFIHALSSMMASSCTFRTARVICFARSLTDISTIMVKASLLPK